MSRNFQTVKRGDRFPTDATMFHIPSSGGGPTPFNLRETVQGKRFIVVAAPGAFTSTCHEEHLPPYIKNLPTFLKKGIDFILVITANDAFVLNSWKKALGADSDKIIFASDTNLELANKLGLTLDLSVAGLGERTGRFALVVGKDGVVQNVFAEKGPEVKHSSADKVLAKL
ncbi:BA75_04108T0 [Komagataella pastoris]|uniref:BA75_04108T0 n=1 Tax=Komagataella pastoris TaxID=4922 RepID=A0A1B2JFV3_PICPA|nr:BA75_04108T0 [Komagataella pastoris]